MDKLAQIESYLKSQSRNKIIFSNCRVPGVDYFNVGSEIAKSLINNPEKSSGFDDLCSQIFNKVSFHQELGSYLAIENIGILFEPDLHLNLRFLLDRYSQGNSLIINSPGQIIENTFYFYDRESNFTINLEGLSYISL